VSEENVELVRRAFAAFSAGDFEDALMLFTPDAAWYTSDRWLEGSAYRGHDGLRRLVAGFTDNFDGLGYDIEEIRAVDDRVVALVHMTGRIKDSGQPISQPLGLVVADFREGAFGEVRAYASWGDALSAVGLEE
jgi:ketosteroid isomerase-like protein